MVASDSVRLLTWNVQGSAGVDVAAVAAVVGATGADVVALQEVQRRQAAALSAELSMGSTRWVFKHWPVVRRAEGLAVLSRHELLRTSTFVLRRRPFWDWRRRVGLTAVADVGGREVAVMNVHLSSRDDARRTSEATAVLDRAVGRFLVVGDLNDLPDRGAHAAFLAAGWVDCWRAVHGVGDEDAAADRAGVGRDPLSARSRTRSAHTGATNWTGGPRAGRPPTQRLDYILAPPGSAVVACEVVADTDRRDHLAGLSDHLPVLATLGLDAGPP